MSFNSGDMRLTDELYSAALNGRLSEVQAQLRAGLCHIDAKDVVGRRDYFKTEDLTILKGIQVLESSSELFAIAIIIIL